MKINEFLAEINMLPEAVHLLNELQESGRIGEEEYQENKLLYEKDRALFYEKILLEKITQKEHSFFAFSLHHLLQIVCNIRKVIKSQPFRSCVCFYSRINQKLIYLAFFNRKSRTKRICKSFSSL